MANEIIILEKGSTRVEIAPGRGGLVRKLQIRGRDILYMDEATFSDPSKNVRGGIPFLFPFAGSLKDAKLAVSGTSLPQHGFARNAEWEVSEKAADSVLLHLKENDEIRRNYPFHFELSMPISAYADSLSIGLAIVNRGAEHLPAAPGWHPYFNCPRDRKHDVRVDIPGFDHSRFVNDAEFNFGIPVGGESNVVGISLPGVGTITLLFAPEMRHLQFWSQPGKDFICIEPFWGPPDTINTPARLDVAPGTAKGLFMSIEFDSPSENEFS